MKNLLVLLELLIIIVFVGCSQAPLYRLSPDISEYEDKFVLYHDDLEIPVSKKGVSTIAVWGEQIKRDMIRISIMYYNNGNELINIFPDEIKVYGYPYINGELKQLHILSTAETIQLLEKQKKRLTLLYAFASGFANADAGESVSTSKSYGTAYTSDGEYLSGSVTTHTKTIDYDKKAEAIEQDAKVYSSIDNLYEDKEKDILKRNTIAPGTFITGDRIFKIIPGKISKRYMIEIPFGNNIHRFWFVLKP